MLDTRAPTAAHAPRATQGNTGFGAGIQGAVTAPPIRCRRQLALRKLIVGAMPGIRAPTAGRARRVRRASTRRRLGVDPAPHVPETRRRLQVLYALAFNEGYCTFGMILLDVGVCP
jgi:hypothetical protein